MDEFTVLALGTRSSAMMYFYTILFALMGSVIGFFPSIPLSWAVWIPISFFVVPAVHVICREMLRLQRRVKDLEKKLEQR
jgi:hypothetical protein